MICLQKNGIPAVATLLTLFICAPRISGGIIQLDEIYFLSYKICDDAISVYLQVDNANGWVGLGFNNKSADMDGSDLFMVAAYSSGSIWGDYHVPSNSGNVEPIRDASQDWYQVSVTWSERSTVIYASRLLITEDTQGDVPLRDAPLYLLWAYNENSDDFDDPHTHRGFLYVNLVAHGSCDDTTDFITSETEAATNPLPTTTEPTPSICPPSGTDLVEHPTSCSLYYVCVEGTAYERECLNGLHFNPNIKACDLPQNVNCTKPLPECPPDGVSFHPYPGNCSLYVICAEGTPSVWTCAPDTCFDPELLECRQNDTVTNAVPRHVMIEKGSPDYWEAVIRCERETSNEAVRVESNGSPQQFYICQGKQYKTTFTCPVFQKFDAQVQNCVSNF